MFIRSYFGLSNKKAEIINPTLHSKIMIYLRVIYTVYLAI